MSKVHVINSATAEAALCGTTDWESAVCLSSLFDFELVYRGDGELPPDDGTQSLRTAVTCAECREASDLDVETQAPKKLVKYRYTITVLCGCELTEKQREYLESDIEGSIGWPANVFPDPEEVPVNEEGDEV